MFHTLVMFLNTPPHPPHLVNLENKSNCDMEYMSETYSILPPLHLTTCFSTLRGKLLCKGLAAGLLKG